MWLGGMVDLGSRMKGSGTNTDLRMWLKSSLGSRVNFYSKVGSKSKNWSSHSWSINRMWVFKIGGSISRYIGVGINVSSRIGSKLGKDTGVNIDSKIKIESQSQGSSSHS